MKHIIKLIVSLLFSFALCATAMAANVKIFLLGGQSNMAAFGASVNELGSPWDTPQDDVWIWQNDLEQNVGWTSLRGGFNGGDANHSSGGDGDHHGPELSFGRLVADAFPNDRIALVKHTEAGTGATMHDGWNPDRGNGLGPGSIYEALLEKTYDGIGRLQNDGHEYEVAGIVFLQGGRDMVNETGVEVENYEQNFANFISGVRTEFGRPNMPAVFGRVNDGALAVREEEYFYGVIRAQEAVAEKDPWAEIVLVDGLPTIDGVHFTSGATIEVGMRLANAYIGIAGSPADLDGDGDIDGDDVDGLVGEIVAGTNDSVFDLTSDGLVDISDRDQWLSDAATHDGFAEPFLLGDANLDGTVDPIDLNALARNWLGQPNTWQGDFNADGVVNIFDLNEIAQNWRQSIPLANAVPVPEPSILLLTLIGLALAWRRPRCS